MPWLRIDDGMVEHLKVASLSDGAFRAHVEAMSFCARNLTDGHIPTAVAKKQGWSKRASELVRAGLWEKEEGGHSIHDYLDYNPSRAQVEAEREAARRRMNRRRSPDVRANNGRSSTEVHPGVREKFNDPDPDPDPDVLSEHPDPERAPARDEAEPEGGGVPRIDWDALDREVRESGQAERYTFRRGAL